MKKLLIAAGVALAAVGMWPAWAAKGSVAVLPANVSRGAADNGAAVTAAIRTSLERHGYQVISQGRVESAIKGQNVDLTKPQNVQSIGGIRSATGTDFVVYPRVLSVGQGVNTQSYQANILVNVGGKSNRDFVHTKQIGQVFRTTVKEPDQAVIGKNDAEQAAERLLEGFYKKY